MSTPSQPDVVHGVVPAKHPSNSATSTAPTESDVEKHAGQGEEAVSPEGEASSSAHGSLREGFLRAAAKGLTWWQAGLYMLAYNISIGILALPMAYAYLGLAGGLLFTAVYALLNYCTSMINWQLSRRHKVDCWPDILGVLFGRYARGFGHVVQGLLQFFLMVVHVITMRKAIEAISAPRYLTCGVAWTFLGAGIMFIPCLYRSLKDCWWLAGASCFSILVATIVTVVSVVATSEYVMDHYAFPPAQSSSTLEVGSGLSVIVFAFTGQLAYPQIAHEMADPEDFPKALKLNAIIQYIMYTISASLLYWFGGSHVKAPALDSATGTLSRVAWGLALPTIVVAGVLPAMMILQNAQRGYWSWRGSPVVEEDSWRAKVSWILIAAILWIMAPVLAEAIPSFMGVVGIAGALLGAGISIILPALVWFCIDWNRPILSRERARSENSIVPFAPTAGQGHVVVDDEAVGRWVCWQTAKTNARQWPFMAWLVILVILLGIFLCIFGAYGAISAMARAEQKSPALRPFSCRAPAGS